jgi:hypothetical protein
VISRLHPTKLHSVKFSQRKKRRGTEKQYSSNFCQQWLKKNTSLHQEGPRKSAWKAVRKFLQAQVKKKPAEGEGKKEVINHEV